MKKTIAIDCDEILSSTVACLLDFHGHTYNGIPMQRSDITGFDWHDIEKFSATKAYDQRYWHHFFSSSSAEQMVPLAGAQTGVQALYDLGYDLKVVTSRRKEVHDLTRNFIQQYFPGLFSDVVFGPSTIDNYKIDKSVLLDRIGAFCLVDDAGHNCIQVAEKGYQAVLLDNPRNQDTQEHPLITRVFSRDEIVAYFTRRVSED